MTTDYQVLLDERNGLEQKRKDMLKAAKELKEQIEDLNARLLEQRRGRRVEKIAKLKAELAKLEESAAPVEVPKAQKARGKKKDVEVAA